MLYGCQTHFGAPIGSDVLRTLKAKRFGLARIDAQAVSTDTMLAMVSEVLAAALVPYVTVATFEQIEALPATALCEWRNEPDINTNFYLPPEDYAREFVEACKVAAMSPVAELGGPVASNLNRRGHDYLLAVIAACGGSLPSNAFGVTHRYGHNDVETSHRLSKWKPWGDFKSREAEYEWFRTTIGAGRPWVISETGWASAEDISEATQAEYAAREFQLAKDMGAKALVWYQVNDGPGSFPIDHFGLRRIDGTWKPVADVVPCEESDDMATATLVISRKDLVPIPEKPGLFAARYPPGTDTVMSVQPDGRIETRPITAIGAWETIRDDGNKAVFIEAAGGTYAIPLVD